MKPLYAESAPDVDNAPQIHPIVSVAWVYQKRVEYRNFFLNRREDQTRGISAYLNRIIYFCCLNAGAIVEGSDGKRIDRKKLLGAIAASLEGKLTLTMTTLWQSDHNLKHNPGAPYSTGAIRRTRQVLKDQGILDFDAVDPGSTWEPPTLKINLAEALVFAEAAEDALLTIFHKLDEDGDWMRYDLDDLPEHRNVITQLAFNAAFEGVCEYRRDEINEADGLPQTPTVPNQAQLAKQFVPKVLSPAFWKDLFKKHVKARSSSKQKVARSDRPSLISPDQLRLVPF